MQSNDGLMSSSLQHKSVGKRKTHSQTAPVYLHFSRVAGEDWVQFMQSEKSSSELLTDGWGRQRYIFLIYCWCPQMFLQACLYKNVNIATTVISLTAVQVNHILSVFEDQPPKKRNFSENKSQLWFHPFFLNTVMFCALWWLSFACFAWVELCWESRKDTGLCALMELQKVRSYFGFWSVEARFIFSRDSERWLRLFGGENCTDNENHWKISSFLHRIIKVKVRFCKVKGVFCATVGASGLNLKTCL